MAGAEVPTPPIWEGGDLVYGAGLMLDTAKKMLEAGEKEAEKLLLGDILRKNNNQRQGNSMITDFFIKRTKNEAEDDCFDEVRDQWQEVMLKRKEKGATLKINKKKTSVSLDEMKKELDRKEKEKEEDNYADKIVGPSKDALRRVAQIRERKKQEKKEEREKKKAEKKEADGEKKPVRRTRRRVEEKTI